jgi:hypothetical protein
LREQGAKFVAVVWQEGAPQPPHVANDEDDLAEEPVSSGAEAAVEDRGLRGRLSSLIGRDLGDRGDDIEARREPALQSAPVPRIDPTDRAIYGADFDTEEPASSAIDPRSAASMVRAAPPEPAARLGRDDLHKLHAVLHELAECRKLIDAAGARTD